MKAAEEWREKASNKLGATRNAWRLDGNIRHVSTSSGKFFKTDATEAALAALMSDTWTASEHEPGRWCVRGSKGKYFHSVYTGFDICDHIDRDPLNNCLENLREADAIINSRNCKKRADNKSGTTGVYRMKGKSPCWCARWRDDSGTQCSEAFSVSRYGESRAEELAIAARRSAAKQLKNYNGEPPPIPCDL